MVRFADLELGRKDPRARNGESGLWKHGQKVEAENTHYDDTCDACAAAGRIIARIMPTPGTEVPRLVWPTGHPSCSPGQAQAGHGGNGQAVESIYHLGSGIRSCAAAIRVPKGALAVLVVLTSGLNYPSQSCRNKCCRWDTGMLGRWQDGICVQ